MLNYAVLVVDTVLVSAFLLIFWQHTNETATVCLYSLYQSNGHESIACTAASPLPRESKDGERESSHPK